MPKERTHWILALKTREQLPQGDLRILLQEEEPSYLLGSVAPDSVFMPLDITLEEKQNPEFFHGQNNVQTLRFWKTAMEQQWVESRSVMAFLYGLTSHLYSDYSFHPLVYYFCGWDSHPDPAIAKGANRRHFRLETLLDLFLVEQFSGLSVPRYLYPLLNEIDLDALSSVAGTLFFPDKPLKGSIMQRFFQKHSYYQVRFSRLDYLSLSWLLRILGISLKGKRDLIYRKPFRKMVPLPLNYRQPVSGEPGQSDWVSRANESAREASELMQRIEKVILTGEMKNLPSGPHPELGIPSGESRGKELIYCNPVTSRKLFLA